MCMPDIGCFKVNADGTSKKAKLATRGIIRDKSGQLVSGFSAHIGYTSATVAELWGVIIALNQLGIQVVRM